MRKALILLALLLAFTSIGLGQGSGPITVKEADGSPICNNCRTFIFGNGSLTVSGNTVTVSGSGGGSGTVTSISVVTANGVSATCATCTTTPALTFVLGAITPTTVNGLTITSSASGVLTIAAGKTLTASNTLTFTGTDGSSVAFGTGGTVAYTTSLPVGANPTASVGLTAVNGVATTFLRSDGAPALDQGIAPTWTGSHTFNNSTGTIFNSNPITLNGNITAAAWTTSGIRIKGTSVTLTDTSSSGTVAAAYTNVLGGNTIAASSSTTFTDYYSTFLSAPAAGTNVTLTNAWALGLSGGLSISSPATTGTTTGSGSVFTANSLTTGTGFYVGSTSTAGSSTTSKLFHVAKSGAQTGSVTTTAATIENTSTGASATNIALTLTASGATTANTALNVTAGNAAFAAQVNADGLRVGDTTTASSKQVRVSDGSNVKILASANTPAMWLGSNVPVQWDSNTAAGNTADLWLFRLTTASLRQGNANNATPVANLFTIGESSRGGTDSNVAGANGTVQSGLGTGTGTLSTLILRSPIAAASGTTAQTYATGLTVIGGTAKMTSYTVATLPAAATVGAGARAFVTDAMAPVFGSAVTGGGAVGVPVYSDGSTWLVG